MGCDMHFACKTCKVDYYLGYSGYGSWWPTQAKAVKEFDDYEDANDTKKLLVNQNFRKCLAEHEGHEFTVWTSDWDFVDDKGDLVTEVNYGKNAVIVQGFRSYQRVNLELSDRCGNEFVRSGCRG